MRNPDQLDNTNWETVLALLKPHKSDILQGILGYATSILLDFAAYVETDLSPQILDLRDNGSKLLESTGQIPLTISSGLNQHIAPLLIEADDPGGPVYDERLNVPFGALQMVSRLASTGSKLSPFDDAVELWKSELCSASYLDILVDEVEQVRDGLGWLTIKVADSRLLIIPSNYESGESFAKHLWRALTTD